MNPSTIHYKDMLSAADYSPCGLAYFRLPLSLRRLEETLLERGRHGVTREVRSYADASAIEARSTSVVSRTTRAAASLFPFRRPTSSLAAVSPSA